MWALALPGGLEDSLPGVCMSNAVTKQSLAFPMLVPSPRKQWSTQPFNLRSHPCHTAAQLCLLLHKSIIQLQLLALLVILPLHTKNIWPNTLAACAVLCHPVRYLLIHLSMILLNYHQSQADHAFLLGISTSHLSIAVSLLFTTIMLRLEFTHLSLAGFRCQGKGMQQWKVVWSEWKHPFSLLHDKPWQAAHDCLWLMHENWEKL